MIITTTVDQATQAHKLVRNLGGPLGVRSALAAGATGSSGLANEVQQMGREGVHLIVGTPGKIGEVLGLRAGVAGSEVRLLIVSSSSFSVSCLC